MIDSNGLAGFFEDVGDFFENAFTSVWGIFSIVLIAIGLLFSVILVILLIRLFRSMFKPEGENDPGQAKEDK
jgi:hypothetical protein